MALPTAEGFSWPNRNVDSARKRLSVDSSQSAASGKESAAEAIFSASSRGGTSRAHSEKTSIAARHSRICDSQGDGSVVNDAHGSSTHQCESTFSADTRRSPPTDRLAARRSSQGAIRGTAQSAMHIAPCRASTASGMSSPHRVLSGSGTGSGVSPGTATTGSTGSAMFEKLLAIPASRTRISSVLTASSETAKVGSEPGQYTVPPRRRVPRRAASHRPSQWTRISKSGSLAVSSLMRTGIGCLPWVSLPSSWTNVSSPSRWPLRTPPGRSHPSWRASNSRLWPIVMPSQEPDSRSPEELASSALRHPLFDALRPSADGDDGLAEA